MAARIQKLIAMLVISLTMVVISLPMNAGAAMPTVDLLAPVTQAVKTPVRLAMAPDGGFYATDPRNSGVLRFNASGDLVKTIKTSYAPQGIAVMANGNIVVTEWDKNHNLAAIYDSESGAKITELSMSFDFADGVAVDNDGSIYVVDSSIFKVFKFTSAGVLDTSFGTSGAIGGYGTANGQFLHPTAIVFEKSTKYDPSGTIAVVDSAGVTGSSRIQFFTKSGVQAGSVGGFNLSGKSVAGLKFTFPMGLATEYNGASLHRMYVVDTFNGTVQVLDMSLATPAYLGFIGEQGEDLSKGQLMLPTDVAFDAINKRLLVSNGFGAVALFGIDGGLTPTDKGAAAPTLTISNPNPIVTGTSATLEGTVTTGSSVTCTVGLVSVPGAVSGSTWDCTVTVPSGTTPVQVKATNASPYAATKTAYVLSSSSASFTVNALAEIGSATPINVTGTNPSGLPLCIKNNNGSCQNTSATSWSVSVALAEGINNVTVTAPAAPTWSGSTILDTTAPVITVSMVNTATAFAHDQVQNISGQLSEANPASVTVNGVSAALNGKIFSAAVVGATSFNIVATDKVGLTSSVAKTIKYDPSRVAIKVTSHADGAVVSSSSQTISGTVSKTGSVTVNGNSATVSGYDWSAPVNLLNGMNTVSIITEDNSAAKLTLVYDSIAPAVSAATPAGDLATRDLSVDMKGSVRLGDSLASVVAGVSYGQEGNVPFEINLSGEGYYPITLVSTNAAGAKSYTVRNVVRDITPPSLNVTFPAGNTTTLVGTAEPGAEVVVKNASGVVGTVSYANSTSWTATLGASTDPLTLVVQATDAAGNQISRFPFAATDGNIDLVGGIADVSDALFCVDTVIAHGPRVSAGAYLTSLQLAHGDIAPLINGVASPDGAIDILDCLLILRKATGN